MRKYIIGIAVLAALFIVAGCVTIVIDDVTMPDTAYQYSSFHVTIDTHLSDVEGEPGGGGILGILIPVGWEPTDVVYTGPDSEGNMIYDEGVTGSIEYGHPAPEGYVWWGFRTDDSYIAQEGDEYSADFDVLTDDQLGTFYLDFVVGYLDIGIPPMLHLTDWSEDNEIWIGIDEEDPYITDTYPHNEDWPSGVPPTENTAGCHWNAGDPDENTRIDVDESTFEVRDSGYDLVDGDVNIDDSDLYDVIVVFEADYLWLGGETYTVETTTYDMAGNSATEIWDFTTGYVNIETRSFGAVKALYAE